MTIWEWIKEITNWILEFPKAISWPFSVLILGLVFIKKFQKPVSDFLENLISAEGPGGWKLKRAVTLEQKFEDQGSESELEKYSSESGDEAEKFIRENPKKVIEEYQRINNGFIFERTFNLIYGTQILLLEHLITKGTEGEKYIDIAIYYNEFLRRSKSTTIQMADYLNFLKDSNFIEYTGEANDLTVKILPYGNDFISYIKVAYPQTYKEKGF